MLSDPGPHRLPQELRQEGAMLLLLMAAYVVEGMRECLGELLKHVELWQ